MAEDSANGGDAAAVSPDRVTFLKLKAMAIFSRLTLIAADIDGDKLQTMDEYALSAMIESLGELKSTFSAAHNSLEELDVASLNSDLPYKFDDKLVSLKASLQREIGKRSVSQHCSTFKMNANDTPSIIVNANRSRLPLLTLPKFSGVYTEWTNFFSMFTSVIDKDADLTQVDKLQHLRSCLSGAALDTIRSLEINEANYKTALDLLHKRFDNKRLIFQAHIREIFGLDKVEVNKLRELTDKVTSHIRALQTLGSREQIADCVIVHLILQRLDKVTQAKWEEHSSSNELPSWDQLAAFLEKRCRTLENVEQAMHMHKGQANRAEKPVSTNQRKSFVVSNASTARCMFCDSSEHQIQHCQRFTNLSPNLRQKEARKLSLCLNCLRKGHQQKDCKSGSCRTCQSRHHTLLHFDRLPTSTSTNQLPASQSISSQSNAMVATSSVLVHALPTRSRSDAVLLATAIILVKNRAGTFVPCRALLDSGSQLNFVTNRLADQLQLRRMKCSAAVSGIGDANFLTEGCSVDIDLKSRTSEFVTQITAVVVQTITDNQPSFSLNTADWNVPSNIPLADPNFNIPQRIDLLIGANLFFELLCVGQIHLASGLPVLQKTLFGWVLSGGAQHNSKLSSFVVNQKSVCDIESNNRLDDLVRRFWEVEHIAEPISKTTKEELDCESHFAQHFSRLPSGEYSVRLPTKLDPQLLGDSYIQAKRRFVTLERKLLRNPDVMESYRAFIKEYLDLKHMSLVPTAAVDECKYFLPHHCVFKEDSSTTKLRVVFDGSAATSSGLSLNDILMTGPTIQPKLFNILIRFRSFPVALTGDICKMYRCVKVSPPDNRLQCILWRDSPGGDLSVYGLDTVTYGTKPAAFLAIRAMHQLAEDESSSFPLGAKIVMRDFYVDDLISGGNTVEEAIEIRKQTTNLLSRGNFRLRKWCSNDPNVLNGIPDADRESFLKFDNSSNITKALGLIWDPLNDTFLFAFTPLIAPEKNSKRSVLSTIARCYDPLGLIGPTLTKAKIILQRMWRDKLDWDESLPQSLDTAWSAFCTAFSDIHYLSFPRYIGTAHEIHAFCDASLEAYGACIYVRSIIDDNFHVQLLCSKARVAPLKTLTVPKLELCAADLLAQLVAEIAKIKLFDCSYYCWSDSTVVLSWLREEPSKFNVFVANRICTIQQRTKGMQWRYVPTSVNPADILSKGASPAELSRSTLWIHGPPFLQAEEHDWPHANVSNPNLPEIRHKALVISNNQIDFSLSFKYINSFSKMQRIFGYVHKFLNIRQSRGTSQLTYENIHQGTQILIRMVQRAQLWPEYAVVKNRENVHPSSSIASLAPFLDDLGIIRVGGRLRNSTLGFEAQHPSILPKDHPLTFAIIMHFHRKYHHAGPQSLLATIRMQYWPIGGRKTVARALRKCIICCRSKPRLVEHIMADLPKERIEASRPFTITGVDYCGPFYYKPEARNKSPQKCYISLFICFATKAVWMELVKDLSTSAFLDALKRFVATRGKPSCIWSDNATNFVGANNELKDLRRLFLSEMHHKDVHAHCLNDGIDWRFIPPRSPHFGGLWEAAVKMAKQHLYRTIGSALLGFDELRTLVCEISAVINSRPLVPISENPDDLDVLTPGHFLIGGPFTSLPVPDLTPLNYNRLDRWQRVTYLQQIFWKKWSEEYLSLLQQRAKWRTPHTNIQINDIVCIKDEHSAPLKWPLGRVTEVIAGKDGAVRVAILRTAAGTVRRAVNKLCVLPVKDCVESTNVSTGGGCSEQQLTPN